MELLHLLPQRIEGIDRAVLYCRPSGLPVGNRVLNPKLTERVDASVFSATVLKHSIAYVGHISQVVYRIVNAAG
jgi:hypothetical protein